MSFTLHPQLEKDTIPVGDLSVCRVLLMNNRRFPWLVLVPRREDLRELFDLSAEDYVTVMAEVRDTAQRFAQLTQAHKMNVAALGNMVPQLHIHIIARFENDPTWPAPVWNSTLAPDPYPIAEHPALLEKIRKVTGC